MDPFDILSSTSWFRNVNDSLKTALASKMIREEVKDGHVFFWEGSVVDSVLIIEEGSLTRTKAVGDDLNPEGSADEQSSDGSSVFVDALSGTGKVTGLLHVMNQEHGMAYATIRSKGDAVVWKIPAQDFVEVLSSDAQFAMEMLSKIAFKMRVGSKSLRGMLNNAKKTIKQRSSVSDSDDVGGEGNDTAPKSVVKVLCYDTTQWVKPAFQPAIQAFNESSTSNEQMLTIQMDFTADRLCEHSATYAAGYDAVCLFVNDRADTNTLRILSMMGVRLLAMRCAGFDRVDTKSAMAHGLTVARVPAYSPYAVAEHAISLLMAVNRRIPAASTRVKMANFTLDNSLLGIDIHGKTVGIMGTGKIGQILCKILNGFGANLICYDVFESSVVTDLGGTYVSKDEIFEQADIIFLMMPLLPSTKHTINEETVSKLKKGCLIVNTARGGLIDTKALIGGLQSGAIGGVGLDVLENEADYFFQDWSAKSIEDQELTSLLGNNRVVLTAHQAFFTKEAVGKIVDTTVDNIKLWKSGLRGLEHPNNCIFDKN
jgi:D-lactate dehydrogenase